MQIRPALSQHYSTIANIYNEYIRLGNATMEEELQRSEDIETWVKKFNDRERLYICEIDEQVVGWGIIKRYSDRKGYRFACETAVYLTQAALGKGYGTHMKKYLIAQCRNLEYRHLVAKIFASNEGSIQYNLKLGYTVVGRQKEIGFRNGKWQDIVILQLLLN